METGPRWSASGAHFDKSPLFGHCGASVCGGTNRLRATIQGMGVDTHLYLLDYCRYTDGVKPLLDTLLTGGDARPARLAYEQAWKVLTEANSRLEYPWTPFYSLLLEENLQEGLALLDGHIPESYVGDWGDSDPDTPTRDPRLVREYLLRYHVCGVIVEGLCIPWNLEFPPVHVVTWCLGKDLYRHSERFEDALCAEIYGRSTAVPYGIYKGDQLVAEDLVRKLSAEIARIASPGSELWSDERYRNLYRLLQLGASSDEFRILASYS